MEKIRFFKMEGAGNDYVYIDGFKENISERLIQQIPRLSDRHFGVGGDGVVFIESSDKLDLKMRMFNADGSESEMCGNAIRCVARYAFDKGHVEKDFFQVETLAGPIGMRLNYDQEVFQSVTASMGKPILEAELLPSKLKGRWFGKSLLVGGREYEISLVSMGNPHIVIFEKNIDQLDLASIGAKIENDVLFPNRVNVEFVEILSRNELRQRTWERGSGETLACGTGACAVGVAAILNGYADNEVLIHLRGGDLTIAWEDESSEVLMTGPANYVFEGEYLF